MKFISEEEWADIIKSPKPDLINEILSSVHNAAVETAIRKLPEIVIKMVATTTAIKAMSSDFYEKNKDFAEHKDIVHSVVQDIESKNPDLDYGEILKQAEPIIKEKIKGLKFGKDLPCDLPDKVNLNLKGNGEI
jgi:hypothetical protein